MAAILVVDDEQSIQALMVRVLERLGHQVTTCGNATEALATSGPFDLLIVDFGLPQTNGRELSAQLRERQSMLPVILMSGYPPSDDVMVPPPALFLQKPMRPAIIVENVNKILLANDATSRADPPSPSTS